MEATIAVDNLSLASSPATPGAYTVMDADSLSSASNIEHTDTDTIPVASTDEGDADGVVHKPKHAAYGPIAGHPVPIRATPRIVSLPPRADAATLLDLLNSPSGTSKVAARVVSMPPGLPISHEHGRTATDGSSFALEEDDSVIIVCNSSTEHASAKFLQGNTDGKSRSFGGIAHIFIDLRRYCCERSTARPPDSGAAWPVVAAVCPLPLVSYLVLLAKRLLMLLHAAGLKARSSSSPTMSLA
jgi:hypothetical protein